MASNQPIIIKLDMLNDQPFLEFAQLAIDLCTVAEKVPDNPVLAESCRLLRRWLETGD